MKKIFVTSVAVCIIITACSGQKSIPTIFPSVTAVVAATARISTPTVRLTFLPESPTTVTNEDLGLAQKVLQDRLDQVLLEEAIVRIEDHHLWVDLTNESDLPLTLKLATNVGQIVFFHSTEPVTSGERVPPDALIIATDTDIATAAIKLDSTPRWWVKFSFTPDGKQKIATYSQSHVGAWLNVAQDNVVIFSTLVEPDMAQDTVSITKNWDEETAKVLAAQLHSGRLPFPLVIAE